MNARMVTRGTALAIVVAGPFWIVGSARADYHLMNGGSGELMLFMITNATPPLLLLVGFSGLWFYARTIGRSNQFLALSVLGAGAACLVLEAANVAFAWNVYTSGYYQGIAEQSYSWQLFRVLFLVGYFPFLISWVLTAMAAARLRVLPWWGAAPLIVSAVVGLPAFRSGAWDEGSAVGYWFLAAVMIGGWLLLAYGLWTAALDRSKTPEDTTLAGAKTSWSPSSLTQPSDESQQRFLKNGSATGGLAQCPLHCFIYGKVPLWMHPIKNYLFTPR